MPHSFGHDVPSDWADRADDDPVFGIYKRCGLWTHDEAAILYAVAKRRRGYWLDIGAHTGWTGAHLAEAGATLTLVDPMFRVRGFLARAEDNLDHRWERVQDLSFLTSQSFFEASKFESREFAGVCIDGDHEPGEPLKDAMGAHQHLAADGVVIFHDFIGQPVREAVVWLMDQGYHAKVYCTPHMVAVCWRGAFMPPDHVPDPELVKLHLEARMREFPWARADWWGK